MADGRRESEPLTGAAEWFWYIAAAVGYITLGVWHKWLLNWFIGPLWLVSVVCVGPAVVERVSSAASVRRR
jgi:hypothetical protein